MIILLLINMNRIRDRDETGEQRVHYLPLKKRSQRHDF